MIRLSLLSVAAGLVSLASLFSIAYAQNDAWGDITGRITWGGDKAPVLADLDLKGHADTKECEKAGKIKDETWIVNPKNMGLRNTFVWLEGAKKGDKLPIHPKLKEVSPKTVEIDQPACAFIAHAVGLREGQDLIAKNSSAIPHNFKFQGNPATNPGGNFLLPPGGQNAIMGLLADRLPVSVECNVHPWMRGWVRVYDHPYYAVTDADGKFTIKDAPAGDYVLKIWHGSGGWLGGAKGKNGEPIAIKAGENKLDDKPYPPPG